MRIHTSCAKYIQQYGGVKLRKRAMCSSSVSEAGETLKALADGREVAGFAEDDEDGIVAGEGADDLGPFLPIEGDGDGLGAAGQGLEEEQVADAIGAEIERGEEPREGGGRIGDVGGDHVGGSTLVVGHLDEAELADIPGKSGLGDLEAACGEELPEDLLAGHAVLADDVEDFGMPLGLQHRRRRAVREG
jgi:hypothetical protein